MRTKTFWLDVLERAVRTAAQSALGFLGVGTGLLDVDWKAAALAVAVATATSLVMSILSVGVGDPGSPSVVGSVAAGAGPVIISKLDEITATLDQAARTGRHTLETTVDNAISFNGGIVPLPEIQAQIDARRQDAAESADLFMQKIGLR